MFEHTKQFFTVIHTAAVGSGSKEISIGGIISVTGLLGTIAGLLGGWDVPLKFLIVAMSIDYLTGILGAIKSKTVNSEVMFWGGIRKITVLIVVGLSVIVDEWVQPGSPVFRTAAIYFYAGREGLSIVENLGIMGVPLPGALRDFLAQLSSDKSKGNPAKSEDQAVKSAEEDKR